MKTPTSLALASTLLLGAFTFGDDLRRPATSSTTLQDAGTLQSSLEEIHGMVGALAKNPPGLRPFKIEIPGGLANSAAIGSANPRLIIDSDGQGGTFVITSILLRTDVPLTGFKAFSCNYLELDGTRFDTRTDDLFGFAGTSVDESADLMGTPVRTVSSASPHEPGGNFPHQLIADCAGPDDIDIQFFARSDDEDLEIHTIVVSGYRVPSHDVTVTYVPGN